MFANISTKSSNVIFSLKTTCAFTTPYSLTTDLIASSSTSCATVDIISMPPRPVLETLPLGGRLLSLRPESNNYFRITCGAGSTASIT